MVQLIIMEDTQLEEVEEDIRDCPECGNRTNHDPDEGCLMCALIRDSILDG